LQPETAHTRRRAQIPDDKSN